MNVGLYFDLRNPPGQAIDATRLYGFTLEMCEEADRLGCHSLWFSEHHLFDDGYLPQPLTMAAAVASRTRRARLGTAVMIAPLHHAAELAEQAIVVDIISGGRLDLGIGAGYRVPEFDLFGADLARRYAVTDSRAVELLALFRTVTPSPVQEPIPVWLGYGGPRGAVRAGTARARVAHRLAGIVGAVPPRAHRGRPRRRHRTHGGGTQRVGRR